MTSPTNQIIELNVGGVYYATSLSTLASSRENESRLARMFASVANGETSSPSPRGVTANTGEPAACARQQNSDVIIRDAKGRYFIDRDGTLFRFILDYLRTGDLILPFGFRERARLLQASEIY